MARGAFPSAARLDFREITARTALAATLLFVIGDQALSGCTAIARSAHPGPAARDDRLAEDELALGAEEARRAGVEVAPAEAQVVDERVSAPGRVTVDEGHLAQVFSPVTGRIVSVRASLGEAVHRGDVLAWVASPDVDQAGADLERARAERAAREHDYRRRSSLFAAQAESAQNLEQAEDAYRQALAEETRAEQKGALLHVGGGGRAPFARSFPLESPIDGRVLSRSLHEGEEVQGQYGGGAAAVLFTIADPSYVHFDAQVHEHDVGRVRAGAPLDVEAVAFPGRRFQGVVRWVAAALDRDSGTVRVRCQVDDPGHLLLPGMYGSAEIDAGAAKVLAIPRNAEVSVAGYPLVFVERKVDADGRRTFGRVPVALDDRGDGAFVAVLRGVAAGDRVVVKGAAALLAAASRPPG